MFMNQVDGFYLNVELIHIIELINMKYNVLRQFKEFP